MNNDHSEQIMERLRAMKPAFKELGLKRVRVFGSVIRGEAGPDSDLDLIVDLNRPIGLIGFAGIKHSLEESLGIKVDLMTQNSLHPALKDRILSEARDV